MCALFLAGCAVEPVSERFGAADLTGLLARAAETPVQTGPELIETLIRTGRIDKAPDWRRHVVTADKRGKMEERMFDAASDDCRRAAAEDIEVFTDCHLGRVLRDLDRALDQHVTGDARTPFRLLLSLHGGLVPETAAVRMTKDHLPLMRADKVYPIFLNWHTGPFNSYGDQIVFVRSGERIDAGRTTGLARAAHVAATPLHVATDIAEGLARAPIQWASQLADLGSDVTDGDKAPDPSYTGAAWGRVDHDTNLISAPGRLPTGETAWERTHYFLTSPFKLATMPFVDGIGKPAWDNMLRRSRAVLKTPTDFHNEPVECRLLARVNRACYRRGAGVFARFLAHLEPLLAHYRNRLRTKTRAASTREADCRLIEVSLVGHSMGAIIANDILRDFELHVCNIVYMGAANSIRHFYNTALPYIERNRGVRFHNLMLHPTNEQREDYAFGLAPEGSLLVWIDSFYEESDSVFDRTLGKWQNVGRTKPLFPADAQKCMIFKVFGIKGRFPTGHGEFNEVYIDRVRSDGRITYDYNYWAPQFWGDARLTAGGRPCR